MLGLDMADAMIIRWFLDFEPFMSKTMYNNEVYGWVSIDKLYQDIPIINIKERALRSKIDNLVKIGIFKKYVKNTQQGKKLYLKAGEKTENLTNKKNLSPETNKAVEDIIKKSKDNSDNDEFLEKPDNQVNITQKTVVSENNIDNSEKRTDNQILAMANSAVAQHTNPAVAKSAMANSAVAQHTNPAVALNDNPISDKPITNSAAYNSINLILTLSDAVFGPKYFAYDFPYKAAAFFKSQKLDIALVGDYFAFVKDKVQNKQNVENPKALTYRLIMAQDMITEFLRHQDEMKHQETLRKSEIETAEQRKVSCPACGSRFNPEEDYCPACGLFKKDFTDERAIKYRRMFVKLPDSLKNAYETEVEDFLANQYSEGFLEFTSPEAKTKRYEKEYELIEKYSRMAG